MIYNPALLATAIALIFLATALVARHVKHWKNVKSDEKINASEKLFARRQCRRRVQSSAMLGLLPIGILVEPWIEPPMGKLALGLSMLMLLGWLLILVGVDFVLAHFHYRRLHQQCLSQQIQLHQDVIRLKANQNKPDQNQQSTDEKEG
jgi:hypothetical protein